MDKRYQCQMKGRLSSQWWKHDDLRNRRCTNEAVYVSKDHIRFCAECRDNLRALAKADIWRGRARLRFLRTSKPIKKQKTVRARGR